MPGIDHKGCEDTCCANACIGLFGAGLIIVAPPAAINFAYVQGGTVAAKITGAVCGGVYAASGAALCWCWSEEIKQCLTKPQSQAAPTSADMTRDSNTTARLLG